MEVPKAPWKYLSSELFCCFQFEIASLIPELSPSFIPELSTSKESTHWLFQDFPHQDSHMKCLANLSQISLTGCRQHEDSNWNWSRISCYSFWSPKVFHVSVCWKVGWAVIADILFVNHSSWTSWTSITDNQWRQDISDWEYSQCLCMFLELMID